MGRFNAGRFPDVTSGGLGPCSHGDPVGDAVKPVPDEVAIADGPRPPDENEEGCLKGVFDVMFVTQYAPADSQHHRPVPRDQGGKRRLVPFGDKPLQELAFGQPGDSSLVKDSIQLFADDALSNDSR